MLSEAISSEIVDGMRNVFGRQLLSVVLYGSVARGDDTPESDVDIAVFLNSPMRKDTRDKMLDRLVEIGWKCDQFVSVIDIEQTHYNEWVEFLPLYKNIRKDGVVLWKAT